MVGATGFEPATLCSQSRCATRLRYAPTFLNYPITEQKRNFHESSVCSCQQKKKHYFVSASDAGEPLLTNRLIA